jgi:hypothetical protein
MPKSYALVALVTWILSDNYICYSFRCGVQTPDMLPSIPLNKFLKHRLVIIYLHAIITEYIYCLKTTIMLVLNIKIQKKHINNIIPDIQKHKILCLKMLCLQINFFFFLPHFTFITSIFTITSITKLFFSPSLI